MTIHFTSGDYLTIRNESGQYSLRIEGNEIESVKSSVSKIDAEILRLNRRRKAYSDFLSGESVQCPSALMSLPHFISR